MSYGGNRDGGRQTRRVGTADGQRPGVAEQGEGIVLIRHADGDSAVRYQLWDGSRDPASGHFVAFSNANLEQNSSLLGLPWSTFPVNDFFFDAVELGSGNIRLRALPRPDSVAALSVRARLYVAELSPKGQVLRSGWYPSEE